MSSNARSGVAESLQEIAKLLLYLFEHYFAEVNDGDSDILLSQISFLRDTGLLCDPLSVLDVVGLYAEAAADHGDGHLHREGDSLSSSSITYEKFYAWLREISTLIYPKEINGRKAFHLLLTERVLPSVSRISLSANHNNELSILSPRSLVTFSLFDEFIQLWFIRITKQDSSGPPDSTVQRSISLNSLVDALVDSGNLDPSSPTQRSDFYTVVQYLVFGGDERTMGPLDKFWSSLRSYHTSYNEFVLVLAGFYASGKGTSADDGVVQFMEKLADYYMDLALNEIVTIDEDFRSFLRPTFNDHLDASRSRARVGSGSDTELWNEECVHVASLWCFARQAGLMASRSALQFMFDLSTSATVARERLESVFPGVGKEANWSKSVLSSISLLVVHAAALDDILFDVINQETLCTPASEAGLQGGGKGSNLELLSSFKTIEAPLRAAFLMPQVLLTRSIQLPSVVRYAYFPYCISQLLTNFGQLEDICGFCNVLGDKRVHREAEGGVENGNRGQNESAVRVTLRALLKLIENCRVTPDWIDPEKCLRVCNRICLSIKSRTPASILSRDNSNPNDSEQNSNVSMLDMALSTLDVYEVLFCVSQVCDNGHNDYNGCVESDIFSDSYSASMGFNGTGVNNCSSSNTMWQSCVIEDAADASVTAWKNMHLLVCKLVSDFEATSVQRSPKQPCIDEAISPIGNSLAPPPPQHHTINDVHSSLLGLTSTTAADTTTTTTPFDRDVYFDANAAAIVCSCLYAPSQPHWRGQWLLQTAVSQIPISSFPLDSPMKCTMDIVLIAAIINYPYSAPDFSVWKLFEIFQQSNPKTTAFDEAHASSVKIMRPVHEICSRRMYTFLRAMCEDYKIRTVDLMSHLQLSLMADDCFASKPEFDSEIDSSNIHQRKQRGEYALRALAALSVQARIVLHLSSKAVWKVLGSIESGLVWEYLQACGGSVRGIAVTTFHIDEQHESSGNTNDLSKYGVKTDLVLTPMPDVAVLKSGSILMRREAAVAWATRVMTIAAAQSKPETQVDVSHVSQSATQFIDQLLQLRWLREADHRGVITFAMFVVFGLHVRCQCLSADVPGPGGDRVVRDAVGEWANEITGGGVEDVRYWDSHVSACTLFLSHNRLSLIMENNNVREVVLKSMEVFDVLQSGGIAPSAAGLLSLVSAIPPRPPGKLWDAPRCVQFCKQMGIVQLLNTELARCNRVCVSGIEFVWCAVALALKKQYTNAKLSPWSSHGVVAPLPLTATLDNVLELLSSIVCNLVKLLPGSSSDIPETLIETLIAKLLLRTLCPIIVSCEVRRGTPVGDFTSFRALEDMLRFGGSRVIATLRDYHSWLIEEFRFVKSSTSMQGIDPLGLEEMSVSVTAACTYFSCGGLLKMKTAIMMAGLALNPRYRESASTGVGGCDVGMDGDVLIWEDNKDVQKMKAANRAAVDVQSGALMEHILSCDKDTQISLQEFEELFIRCAFALYEQAGCTSSTSKGKPSNGGFEHCKTADTKHLVRHYCSECENVSLMVHGKSSSNQFTAGAWGTDFLFPLSSTLQLASAKRDRNFFQCSQLLSASRVSLSGSAEKGASVTSGIIDVVRSTLGESVSLSAPQKNCLNSGPHAQVQLKHEAMPATNSRSLQGIRGSKDISSSGVDVAAVSTSAISPNVSLSMSIGSLNTADGSSLLSPSANSGNGGVGIVDDAIIRGRDKYLDTILASRHIPPVAQAEDQGVGNRSPSSVQLKLSVPTRTSSERRSPYVGPPRDSPPKARGSPRTTRSPQRRCSPSPQSPAATERSMGIDALLDGTKEVLWPVFATYCSCGDSMEPGKLSGPNLFALLSKLNVLTEETALSDLGVLLHQVSSHTTAQAPTTSLFVDFDDENGLDSPLLSFEEFLVFLCAFSHLRYEGTSVLPDFSEISPGVRSSSGGEPGSPGGDSLSSMMELNGPTGETWLECWYHVMVTSPSFRRLLEECVLPLLQKQALLAFPEDARHRDEYILIFSIEILMTIQSNEHHLRRPFERHRRIDRNKALDNVPFKSHFVIAALEKIKIVPQKVSRTEVLQFVEDILPKADKTSQGRELTFPQWEWVLCIVAVKAVTNAIGRNCSVRDAKMKNIIPFVSEVLAALAAAVVQNDQYC